MQKKICAVALCSCILMSLAGCKTPAEQAAIDKSNTEKAQKIADVYFDADFKYEYDFYYNTGEFGNKDYLYVYSDGNVINCIAIPATENGAGPFVYYDCEIGEYNSGRKYLADFNSSEPVVEE